MLAEKSARRGEDQPIGASAAGVAGSGAFVVVVVLEPDGTMASGGLLGSSTVSIR